MIGIAAFAVPIMLGGGVGICAVDAWRAIDPVDRLWRAFLACCFAVAAVAHVMAVGA